MFERNRIDRGNPNDRITALVELVLDGGETVSGRLHFPSTRTLGEEINSGSGYVDFETLAGDRYFLAKQSIHVIKPSQIPRADHLTRGQGRADAFNPWVVLGVAETASKDEIREAYHRQVKQYHPDRFANLALPPEVKDYINAMSRRVNSAYAALNASTKRETAATAAP